MRKRTVKKKMTRKHINLVNKKSQKKLNDFRNYFSKVILILFMVVLGVEATVRISSSLGILGDFQMAYIDENLLKLPQSNSSNSTVADAVIVGDEMIENVKINFQGKSVLNLAGKDKTLADYNKLVEIAETYRAKNIFYFISANDFKIENNTPIRQLTTNSITPLIEAKSIAEDWNNLVKRSWVQSTDSFVLLVFTGQSARLLKTHLKNGSKELKLI